VRIPGELPASNNRKPTMDLSQIQTLTGTFEGHAQQTETGIEYWLARDIQQLLGYSKWENFQAVVAKAKTACEVSGHPVENHFPDVKKMVEQNLMFLRFLLEKVGRKLSAQLFLAVMLTGKYDLM
jgi:hypothetical protein